MYTATRRPGTAHHSLDTLSLPGTPVRPQSALASGLATPIWTHVPIQFSPRAANLDEQPAHLGPDLFRDLDARRGGQQTPNGSLVWKGAFQWPRSLSPGTPQMTAGPPTHSTTTRPSPFNVGHQVQLLSPKGLASPMSNTTRSLPSLPARRSFPLATNESFPQQTLNISLPARSGTAQATAVAFSQFMPKFPEASQATPNESNK